jgi:hypothetical protein
MIPGRMTACSRRHQDEKPVRRHERLHWTVVARYQQDLGYRPRNLVDYVRLTA